MKSILLKIIAMETVVFSLFSLTARVVLVLRSLRHVYSTCVKDRKETNPIHHLQHLFDCIVNWSTFDGDSTVYSLHNLRCSSVSS